MPRQHLVEFLVTAQQRQQGMVPVRTKTGRKIHLMHADRRADGQQQILCQSGVMVASSQELQEIPIAEIEKNKIYITCIRCLKINSLNDPNAAYQVQEVVGGGAQPRQERTEVLDGADESNKGAGLFILGGIILFLIVIGLVINQ